MTHNANIIKDQIQTDVVKRITYLEIVKLCVMFTLTRAHCDPAADHFTWYYITTLHRVFDVSQNVAFQRISRRAHRFNIESSKI